ncbi:DUF433 domain-containing protein [Candidatus Bipolaricaulota bacterium]|nr:DUF433 domain-containing protein [Candidatus Bipolaricaulota bacterium]MBS3792405.1 DUF433 domain-containing protein [Candidatus Bipolaricaulota bacterium]MBS3813012.1 DUF433 domain-containing protein [Candidatus Bipolaricaulota bacterium]
MNPVKSNEYIEKREGVCGGKEVIKGHRIPVWEIAEVYNMGADWGELATRFETLSVLEIREAIDYYEENKETIDQQIEENKLENILDSDIPNSHVLNGSS